MYRKILVAFDGSMSSENALRQACRLASLEKSWIKVVAVVPAYEGDLELVGVSDLDRVLKGPTEKLVQGAEEIARSESTHIITNVERGEAYERIVDVSQEENCNLIVMGRRGRRRIEKMLMGSVTSRVIAHSSKDVLVVPRDAMPDFKRMLLATDGSEFSNMALDRALYFAKAAGGSITALSVVDVYPEFYAEAPEIVEKLEAKAISIISDTRARTKEAGVDIETKLMRGNAPEEIVSYAQESNAGVIVMGSRGKSRLKRLVVGSVTEKVIGLSNLAVLVAKPQG